MSALRWLERNFEELICCTGLAAIAFCVFAQVIARYVFQTALHWSEEVASICMVWSVYMGASLCVRERFHIRIIVAVKALPERYGRIVIFLADLIWAAFCIFMIRVSWDYLAVLWKFTSRSPSLGIDQFYPQSILVIGYALMLIRLFQTYINWYKEGGHGIPGMLDEEWEDTVDEREHQL